MKKIFLFLLLLSFACYPQIKDLSVQKYFLQEDFEFGFFANIGRHNITHKAAVQTWEGTISKSEYSDSELYFHFGVTAAYFIINNLSVEPELDINLFNENSSFTVTGNLNYSFSKPASEVYPFVRIGYGWSDYKNNYYTFGGSFNGEDYRVINAGAGLKIRYSTSMMFRLEVNYRILNNTTTSSYSYPGYSESNKTESDIRIISFSFGTSIIF